MNPPDIDAMFGPACDGTTLQLDAPVSRNAVYGAWADPAIKRDNFSFVIAHEEERFGGSGGAHVVIDVIRVWRPRDFSDGEVAFRMVADQIVALLLRYGVSWFYFDQGDSHLLKQNLRQRMASANRRIDIDVRRTTHQSNRAVALTFRAALATRRVHCPYFSLLDQELRHLEQRGDRVDHPTSGDVITNDVATSVMYVVAEFMADGAHARQQLSGSSLHAFALPPDSEISQPFRAVNRASPMGGVNPAKLPPDRRPRR